MSFFPCIRFALIAALALFANQQASHAAQTSPLWINEIVRDVATELGTGNADQVTAIVGERLKEMAEVSDDSNKRVYLDYLIGEGNEIERWGAFRSFLSSRGYVMLLEAHKGYLVLPHSGYRFRFDDSGSQAAQAFEDLFGHLLPADAAPWVVDDQPGNPGGRSGWGWYSDAAVNLKGELRLTLDAQCRMEPAAKTAMIAINETTHTVLFREFGFGQQLDHDWQGLTQALGNTPVSREGEINEFLSDVASVNSNRCAFILVFDHLLDRYIYGTEDDHHLSGRFFRDRVSAWEKHTGSQSVGEFERRLGKILTATSDKNRDRAIDQVSQYLMNEILSADFITYIQAEYMTAGRQVLALLRK